MSFNHFRRATHAPADVLLGSSCCNSHMNPSTFPKKTQILSPVINLNGKSWQPTHTCQSARMHAKLCAGAKDGQESHFPTLPALSFLPLSSWARCHHLVVEVASHGPTVPDLSHLHALKAKHLPRPEQNSQEHTPEEW